MLISLPSAAAKRIEKRKKESVWHLWYAWYPVRINNDSLLVFGYVYRKVNTKLGPNLNRFSKIPYYEYVAIDDFLKADNLSNPTTSGQASNQSNRNLTTLTLQTDVKLFDILTRKIN